jgi:hypothetical protein
VLAPAVVLAFAGHAAAQTSLTAGDESQLRSAIFQASNDVAQDGGAGGSHTIDADNTGRTFFVESGRVLIKNISAAAVCPVRERRGAPVRCSWPPA